MIKKLENETNTKIVLQKDTGMLERDFSKLRSVLILGEKEEIIKGLVKIVANNLTPDYDSPYLQVFLIPGGETESSSQIPRGRFAQISKLNGETVARLKVVNLGPSGIYGIEVFSASQEEMEEAVEKYMEFFQPDGVFEESGNDGHNHQQLIDVLKSGSIEEQAELIKKRKIISFLIPEEKTGLLVGPKGSTIKELEVSNDVKLVVEKKEAPYFESGRVVLVLGEVQKICECLAAVTDKIFDRDNMDPRVVCLLPAGVPKYLIGYSGETIKRMEVESGCRLKVEHVNTRRNGQMGDQDSEQYCQIKGTREKIVRGILAVVSRILLQLVLQGQTSDDGIPLYANFGNFGSFGRRMAKEILNKRRLRQQLVPRPVQESFAPDRAPVSLTRPYDRQDGRGVIFDDIVPQRHSENLGQYQRGVSVGLPPEQEWSARLTYERIEPRRADLQESWTRTIREPIISDGMVSRIPGEWNAGSSLTVGREAIGGLDIDDRSYGANRGTKRRAQSEWPPSSQYADAPIRRPKPRYY